MCLWDWLSACSAYCSCRPLKGHGHCQVLMLNPLQSNRCFAMLRYWQQFVSLLDSVALMFAHSQAACNM